MMKEYEFTLKFRLADAGADPAHYLDALVETGCTDAIVGIGKLGRIALTFNREAQNAFEAMKSAIENVQSAIAGLTLIEASPDYVGVTDIADVLSFTRQNMLKLLKNHSSSFPNPVHEGRSSLWHLADVLGWFQSEQSRQIAPTLLEVADIAKQLNLFRDVVQLTEPPKIDKVLKVMNQNDKLGSSISQML